MNWTKYERNVSAFDCAESTDANIRKIARALRVGAHVGGDIARAKGRQEWLTRCYGYAFDLTGVRAEEAKVWWRRIREIGGLDLTAASASIRRSGRFSS